MKHFYLTKRLLAFALLLIMLCSFFACAEKTDVLPTATPITTLTPTTKPTATPTQEPTPTPENKKTALERAKEAMEYALNLKDSDYYDFEGCIVKVIHENLYYVFTYSSISGLHGTEIGSSFPYLSTSGMDNITPEKQNNKIRIFVYEKETLQEDSALIDSLYNAINEKRYEDYINHFSGDNYWYDTKEQIIAKINDSKTKKNKEGIYNIKKVEDIKILTVFPLDEDYAEYERYWHKSVLPYEGFTDFPQTEIDRYCYDVINPMFYLVSNEYTVHNEPEEYDDYYSGGTHYWYILVGSKMGERKIQGIWPADYVDVEEFEPDKEKVQEYYNKVLLNKYPPINPG